MKVSVPLIVSLFALLAMAPPSRCAAQGQAKPFLVVSIANLEEGVATLRLLNELTDTSDSCKDWDWILKARDGKPLDGLDVKRPVGFLFFDDAKEPYAMGVVPVTSLKRTVAAIQRVTGWKNTIEFHDDVYQFGTGGNSVYARQCGAWAYLGNHRELVRKLPADLAASLGDLPQRYDVAVRVAMKRLPAGWRDSWLSWLREIRDASKPQGDLSNDLGIAVGASIGLYQAVQTAADAEDILVGVNVDRGRGALHVDYEATARPDTKLAKQSTATKAVASDFSGLLASKAAISMISTGVLNDEAVASATSILSALGNGLPHLGMPPGIDADQWSADVMACFQKTIDAKKYDGGMALFVKPGGSTFVAGCRIVEGNKLEIRLLELLTAFEADDPSAVTSVTLNAETHQGVRFHAFSMPTPDGELVSLFGETLEVVLGIADDKLFLAAGCDAAQTLKQVIDRSKATPQETAYLQVSLSGAQFLRLGAEVSGEYSQTKENLRTWAEELEVLGTPDRATITVHPIPSGVRYHLEMEKGAVKAWKAYVAASTGKGDLEAVNELPFWDWSEIWSQCEPIGRIVVWTEAIRSTPKADGKSLAQAYRHRAEAYGDLVIDCGLFTLTAYDQAMSDYSESIRIDPTNGETYLARGMESFPIDKTDAAVRDLREAIRLSPNDAKVRGRAHFFCAQAEMQRREFRQAIEDYSALIKIDPENSMYVARARAYQAQGDLDRAIADYSTIIQRKPEGWMYAGRGSIRQLQGKFDAAIADFDESLRRTPDSSKFHYLRGLAYAQEGELDQAIADFTRSIDIGEDCLAKSGGTTDVSFVWAHQKRGELYQKRGKKELAEKDFAAAKDGGIDMLMRHAKDGGAF